MLQYLNIAKYNFGSKYTVSIRKIMLFLRAEHMYFVIYFCHVYSIILINF